MVVRSSTKRAGLLSMLGLMQRTKCGSAAFISPMSEASDVLKSWLTVVLRLFSASLATRFIDRFIDLRFSFSASRRFAPCQQMGVRRSKAGAHRRGG